LSVLILNRVPHHWCDYKNLAAKLQEDLILLTDEKVSQPFLTGDFVHIESDVNYDNSNLLSLRVRELNHKYSFSRVIAISEFDLIRAAEIRELLGLEGQSLKSAQQFRDKVRMKEQLKDKCTQLRIPKFTRVEDIFDLLNFIQENGYPVLIKPVDGGGASGITILTNEEDLWRFAEKEIPVQMEVEEYFQGEEYHIDGVIDQNELKLISVSKYLSPQFQYDNNNFISASVMLHPENSLHDRLANAITEVLEVMDTPKSMTFHAECLITLNDEIIFIEIASRAGGGRISKMIEVGYGYDLLPLTAELQAGLPFPRSYIGQVPRKLGGAVLAMAKKGTLISVPKEKLPHWVYEYLQEVEEGTSFQGPKNSCDSVASFIVGGESEKEVEQRLHEALQWFDTNSIWTD
jgi:biotin carboxylase